MHTNPFYRRLGYEVLFPIDTLFYHLSADVSKSGYPSSTLNIPVLNSNTSEVIEWGTVVVAAIGFLWISLKIVLTRTRSSVISVAHVEKKVQ